MLGNHFNPSSFKKYFSSTSWLLVDRGIRIIILFLVWMQVTRYLGPEQFGIFSYAISVVSIFTILSNLGLDDILMKELIESKNNAEKEYELLGTAFGLRLGGAIVLLMITSTVAFFLNESSLVKYLMVVIAASFLVDGFRVIIVYFQSIVESKSIAIVQLVQTIFTSGIKYGLVFLKVPLIVFGYMMCLEAFILAIGLSLVFQYRTHAMQHWKFNQSLAIRLLKKSWPLILSSIAAILYIRIDQIMIKYMLDNASIGYYAAAVRIFETWFFIPTIVVTSLLPAIVNSKQKSKALYMDRFQQLYDLVAGLAVMITIIMFLFSGNIVHFILGSQYSPAIGVLKLHSLSGIFVFLNIAASRYLVTEDRLKISFWVTIIGAIVNIFLNRNLIPIYGIYGASIATIISQGVGLFLMGVLKKDKLFLFSLIRSVTLISPLQRIFNRLITVKNN